LYTPQQFFRGAPSTVRLMVVTAAVAAMPALYFPPAAAAEVPDQAAIGLGQSQGWVVCHTKKQNHRWRCNDDYAVSITSKQKRSTQVLVKFTTSAVIWPNGTRTYQMQGIVRIRKDGYIYWAKTFNVHRI
jgi:hypothetical protein